MALAGPPALQVFGEVEPSWVIDAMRVDLSLRGAAGWYRVLNACRTAHFLDEGSMCGKLEGAAWYRTRTADPGLIDAALTWRLTGRGPPLPRDAVDEFVGVVLARLSEASPRVGPGRSSRAPSAGRSSRSVPSQPLVSCVLAAPANAELLALAARRFIQQDWADRELLVAPPAERGQRRGAAARSPDPDRRDQRGGPGHLARRGAGGGPGSDPRRLGSAHLVRHRPADAPGGRSCSPRSVARW